MDWGSWSKLETKVSGQEVTDIGQRFRSCLVFMCTNPVSIAFTRLHSHGLFSFEGHRFQQAASFEFVNIR